ncbi:MAG: exopolysaccharide biosynthesis polyprenyl glycosylphosphotransferase [Lachnospiraceae bacterium]|nr:exopolysaccharide biosynthesis polyprenyl glycosylphosphotransferase [Lachnospiraceae bacterium]
MKNWKHDLVLRLVKSLDALLLTVPFAVCWYGYYASRIVEPFYNKGNWLMIALFLLLYVAYGKVYDGFLVSLNSIANMIYSQALAAIFSDFIMYVVTWLLTKHLPSPLPLLAALGSQLILASLWCVLASKWYFAVFPPKKSAVIYDERQGLERLISEYGLEKKFDICATAEVGECLKNIKMLDRLDAVFLSGIHSHDRNIILKYCIAGGINVYVIPRVGDVIMSGARQMHLFHLPMLRVGRYCPSPIYLLAKRALDLIISCAAIIVLSPILLLTAAAIRVEDGGPVLYRQCRLTKDGRKFNVLKFRSMCVDAEKDGIARLSTGPEDERVTKVGRFIRRARIDELPQLFCVLRGTMSLVGPRPERPEIAAVYEREIPEFQLRLQAKAGLTGYAQVYGKYNTTPYDKLQMDLMYIAHPSIIEDLRILFATVKILFAPKSTEGVESGCINALDEPAASREERGRNGEENYNHP